MALTSEQIEIAKEIVNGWNWQLAEGHNYRFKHAVKTLVRFYEQPSMEADVFKIVLEYLRSEEGITSVALNQKSVELEGTWKAKDAWYQTANGDKFENVDQERVRIYQILVGKDDEGEAGDGPYLTENGITYQVYRTYFWDVEAEPEALAPDGDGVVTKIEGLTRDRETGLYSYILERRVELPKTATSESVRTTLRGTWTTTESTNVEPVLGEDGNEVPLTAPIGGSSERSVTAGDRRNTKVVAFESATKEAGIILSKDHQLNAFTHEDRVEEVLEDGSDFDAEPDDLKIVDTDVASPLPIPEGKSKPDGFKNTGDCDGSGTGRVITRTILKRNEETNQIERTTVTITTHPYKKVLAWHTDKAKRGMVIFRDLTEVPNIDEHFSGEGTTFTADDVTPQVQINEYGLFSGVISWYKSLRDTGGGGSTDETSYNKSAKITIKQRYTKPGGRNYIRTYEVTRHWMSGTASGAANAYGNGTEYPYLGLHASYKTSGQRGTAVWYDSDLTLKSDEPEA